MAIGPRLDLKQTQNLVMTPQLQQAIKLLQYSAQEINDFVDQELDSNPLLERKEQKDQNDLTPKTIDHDPSHDSSSETVQMGEAQDSADYLNDNRLGSDEAASPLDGDFSNNYDGDIAGAGAITESFDSSINYGASGGNFDDDEDFNQNRYLSKPESLRDHLVDQLGTAFNDPIERAIALYLIDHIEPTGWLGIECDAAAKALGVTGDTIKIILKKCQQFDPPGVFARSLRECLRLQLMDKNRYDPAMKLLLSNLGVVAQRDWKKLQRLCQVSREDLVEMIHEIRQLNPKPGTKFDFDPAQGVEPDVLIHQAENGEFFIELNPATVPRLIVNDRLFTKVNLDKKSDGATKEYIQQQKQNASWLVKSLRQRAETILKVTEEIVRQQSGFFYFGISYLRPLVLREVAAAIEMHESTVSRVTNHKYLYCSRGMFELKYFFSATIAGSDGDSHSAEAVRHRIKALIDAEPAQKILSDDRLVDLLKQEGVDLARRTVAKYREAMGIPSSVQRRRQKQAEKLE
ncbi:MAG: RNA polymerase factor sigma-54 [Alphaproteobacteria bacterium]